MDVVVSKAFFRSRSTVLTQPLLSKKMQMIVADMKMFNQLFNNPVLN